jgi:hypothetical protein
MAWSTSYVTRLSKTEKRARRLREGPEDCLQFICSIYHFKGEEMIVGLVGVYPGVYIECFITSSKERDIEDNISVGQTESKNHVQLGSHAFPFS